MRCLMGILPASFRFLTNKNNIFLLLFVAVTIFVNFVIFQSPFSNLRFHIFLTLLQIIAVGPLLYSTVKDYSICIAYGKNLKNHRITYAEKEFMFFSYYDYKACFFLCLFLFALSCVCVFYNIFSILINYDNSTNVVLGLICIFYFYIIFIIDYIEKEIKAKIYENIGNCKFKETFCQLL